MMTVLPIPLRPGVIAQVHIPDDLTKTEAEKISRIVLAMAYDDKTQVQSSIQESVENPQANEGCA